MDEEEDGEGVPEREGEIRWIARRAKLRLFLSMRITYSIMRLALAAFCRPLGLPMCNNEDACHGMDRQVETQNVPESLDVPIRLLCAQSGLNHHTETVR